MKVLGKHQIIAHVELEFLFYNSRIRIILRKIIKKRSFIQWLHLLFQFIIVFSDALIVANQLLYFA